jgi:hypothetical protein
MGDMGRSPYVYFFVVSYHVKIFAMILPNVVEARMHNDSFGVCLSLLLNFFIFQLFELAFLCLMVIVVVFWGLPLIVLVLESIK